jgi:hypothetical protein
LKSTTIAGPVAASDPHFLEAAEGAAAAPASSPSWVAKPMRRAQLTLADEDPANLNLSCWLDYLQRTRSDAICLGGACVTYYPAQVPFHHHSR